jgi:hypothetical protein
MTLENDHQRFPFPFMLGQRLQRSEAHYLLGGNPRAGIANCADQPFVLLFSDPGLGEPFGYHVHEGLRADGIYQFSGEGKRGDQEWVRGNFALAEAAKRNKSLHLFLPEERHQVYVGEFVLSKRRWISAVAPDITDKPRFIFVFELVLAGGCDLTEAYFASLDVDLQLRPS